MINKNEIPKSWEIIKLGEIAEKITDGTHHTPTYTSEGMPFISVKDIHNQKVYFDNCKYISVDEHKELIKRCNPEAGDVLITKSGTIGRLAIVPNVEFSLFVSVALIKIQENKNRISQKWLLYFLENHIAFLDINSKVKGGVVKNYHLEDLRKIEITLPPLAEQERIIAKIEELFSELDAGTESLKRAQQQLKIYRQAVLKYAFEGKLTNENLHDGELPNGWKLVEMGKVIEQPKYGTSKKCDYKFEGKAVLRIPNIGNNLVDDSDLKFASFDEKEIETYCLKEGDLLTIRSNGSVDLVGKCALITKRDEEFLFAGYLIRLRPLKEIINPKFLINVLSSSNLRIQIESKAKSTSGVNNINSNELKSLIIPLCSLEEQPRIVEEIESRLSVCDKLEETIKESLQQAGSLRQSILKKAFEGKLVAAKKETKSLSNQQIRFHQLQVLGLILTICKIKGIRHGQMTSAKYLYLLDKIFGIKTYYNFKRGNLGPFPGDFKKTVFNKEYFAHNYNQIEVINENRLFNSPNPHKQEIENALDEITGIFLKTKDKSKRSHKTELLATVCKVIEDIQTTDIKAVRQSMAEWKIDLKDRKFNDKAEKFGEDETAKCVAFIIKNGWDKKLINQEK